MFLQGTVLNEGGLADAAIFGIINISQADNQDRFGGRRRRVDAYQENGLSPVWRL